MIEATEPSIRQLREMVESASRGNPHLTSRLEKAAFLVLLRRIEDLGENHFRVGSEDSLRDYDVINGDCRSSDYIRHGVGHLVDTGYRCSDVSRTRLA